MNNMQAVVMPQVIFGDISVCSEEYHSDYFIAAPSLDPCGNITSCGEYEYTTGELTEDILYYS